MNSTSVVTSRSSVSLVAVLAMLVGAAIFGYGLLLVPVSVFGGAWIAAIGLSLGLSGLFAIPWVGDRLGLTAATRRTLSLSFAIFAAFLLVAFVVVNYASVESSVLA